MATRRKLYYLVQGKAFEYVIMAVIVANSALMATSYYGQPEEMSRIVEAINYAFTGVYVLEFVLKVRGLVGNSPPYVLVPNMQLAMPMQYWIADTLYLGVTNGR